MKLVCQAIHPRQIKEMHNCDSDMLHKYTTVVDKYFLQKDLASATELWLRKSLDKVVLISTDTVPWLNASILLDQPYVFEQVTKIMTMTYPIRTQDEILEEISCEDDQRWRLKCKSCPLIFNHL